MRGFKLKGQKKTLNDIENNPSDISIDFSDYEILRFKARNIRNCLLFGYMGENHFLNKTNILFCKLNRLFAQNVSFTSVDIKDSHLYRSSFTKCYFNDAALINNLIEKVKFDGCTFNMTSITGTQFNNVTFENCDFSNVVINTCQFISCKFKGCKTSNKVIEMSFLYNSRFFKTNIQLETILENFGLNQSNLKQCFIKVGENLLPQGKTLNISIRKLIELSNLTNIEKFRLEYFNNPEILFQGSTFLDQTYLIKNWIELCAIPKSFSLLLENYHDFLAKSYEENKLPAFNLLKLHSMTGLLLEQEISNTEVLRSISGVHLSLTRFTENFLNVLIAEVLNTTKTELILLVNGPLDQSYYLENLTPIFENTNLKIEKVIKHNSPNELILSWVTIKDILPIIAIFLATRFKLEFEKVKQKNTTKIKKQAGVLLPVKSLKESKDLQSFSLELGFDKDESFLYQLKLKVLTPGDLLMNLQLGFNTKMFGKIKGILIDILSESRKK